ncbi:olfactory receptor 1S1-like [Discoglossus pictus]
MCEVNQTVITEVLLLGFKGFENFRVLFFLLILVIYIIILTGNILIVVLVSVSRNLKSPMYIFLKTLAVADILFTSNIIPQLLSVVLTDGETISISDCIFQYYFHSFIAFVQSFLLMVMSFDRYLAICNPLRYSSIMSPRHCLYLIVFSWVLSFTLISGEMFFIFQLQFCDYRTVDHFFCDIAPIVELASSDVYLLLWCDFVLALLVIFCPFLFVIISYVLIVIAILMISTNTERRKAFSTCSAHLVVVCTYYGTLVAIYMVPSVSDSFNENKFRALLYTVLAPFINPIIYSLRNQEIRAAMKKLIDKTVLKRND